MPAEQALAAACIVSALSGQGTCQTNSPIRTLEQLDVERGDDIRVHVASSTSSCTIRCARWWAQLAAAGAGQQTSELCAGPWRRATGARLRPHRACGGLTLVGVEY